MTTGDEVGISAEAAAKVIDGLTDHGVAVLDGALPPELVDALWSRAERHPVEDFAFGGVGRGNDRHHESLRNDRIVWLDLDDAITRSYFDWIESLRHELNRTLFLGLFDYECHLAWYPPGSFYRRHLDAFRGGTSRRLSTVVYLNREWTDDDGGELVLHPRETPEPGAARSRTIAPLYGRLVVFLSEEVPHEVLPAQRSRYSIAGWFRAA